MTISITEWLESIATQILSSPDINNQDINLLLCYLLDKNTAWLYAHQDFMLNQDQVTQLDQWVNQLKKGFPLAYITGTKPFWTLNLQVNKYTLIPRPETELLIESIEQLCDDPKDILDLGTGSGAIALSLATIFPKAKIVATDQSTEAIEVAQNNAELNKLTQIEFRVASWFEQLPLHQFDVIVSNPPYIDPNDEHLTALRHEPITALVADENGLADFRTITKNASPYLKPGGLLIFEHGWKQKNDVQKILLESGFLNVNSKKDLLGHDRITWGYFKT